MIETDRLRLRAWTEADAEDLYLHASNPEVGPPAGWPPHQSVEESREVIREVFSAPDVYAVVFRETGRPVGCCGLIHSDERPGEPEVGYWIGRTYWGLGLIPEAVGVLLDDVFGGSATEMVWCSHYEGNSKSRRVCEKCGFRYHHTDYDVATPLGDRRTVHYYLLTRKEYLRQRGLSED